MARPKILVADDNLHVRRALVRELRALGEIVEATRGDEALALLAEHALDVVVSDLEMPGHYGDVVLAAVARQQPGCARILLSGADENTLAGVTSAQYILRKPWTGGELSALISRLITGEDEHGRERHRESTSGACAAGDPKGSP